VKEKVIHSSSGKLNRIKSMRILYYILLILAFIVIFNEILFSENSINKVNIDKILINGNELTPKEMDYIVFSRKDTIVFFYHCEAKEGEDAPFLFKLKIKNSRNESTHPATRIRKALYTNLPEDDYELGISAFSSSEQWNSVPAVIRFRVDDRESELIAELSALKSKIELDKQIIEEFGEINKSDIFLIILSFIIGTVFAFIFSVVVLKKKISKKSENLSNNIKRVEKMADDVLQNSEKELELTNSEDSNLQSELNSLRGQINNMQIRSDELRLQNNELRKKIELIAKSKTEIEELQAQKDELFAIIIHDIKNPVALIKNLVELLRSYDLTATEQQEVINDIFITTNRIVTLSQEVSKILALETNTLTLNYLRVDVNDILSDVVNRYSQKAKDKSITIHFTRNNDIPDCEIDSMKIDDVIDNLLSNAVKFSYDNSKIQVGVSRQDDTLVVNVSDNGQGLSEADVKKAFQRGAMLTARPTGDEHSSGLGLWIVKKLVAAHNGRVWIKSAVGKGSTFYFSFPIEQSNKGQEQEPEQKGFNI